MSDPSDRDLSAAFEELRAPASTANYATRTPGHDVPSVRARWPQAVATLLAVALAIAGAGTFLALRNARQGGAPASSTGNPPARVGAAMAYDSTAGMTVMYGGTDSSGRPLTDTWTWNGATWSAAATGPGPLAETRMVDDPADGGVLLLGIPAPSVNGSSGSIGSGCISSGTGTATAGSAPAIATPPVVSGAPAIATAPPLPPANRPPPIVPGPTCPSIVAPFAEQTWLFSGHGWHLVASGSLETMPAAGSELTFDPTTQQVVAVSSGVFSCGPPLESAGAAIACPLVGGAGVKSGTSTAPGVPCDVAGACFGSGSATWTWSRGYWQRQPAGALQVSGITVLFNDPATRHATLMAQYTPVWSGQPCRLCPMPLATPRLTTWSWTGSGWTQLSQVSTTQPAPSFAGASVAAIAGHVVMLTSAGQTWTFAAGRWTQDAVARHPSTRSGAAMAEGPSETAILFGGIANSAYVQTSGGPASGAVGSDTWVWKGDQWRQAGGTAPSPPAAPSICPPLSNGTTPYCVVPPVKILPATAPGVPPRANASSVPISAP